MAIKDILNFAGEQGASDLHLKVGHPPYLRIDGKLISLNKILNKEIDKIDNEFLRESLEEILTAKQKEKFFTTKDLDFSLGLEKFRYRINLCFERKNIMLTARLINKEIPDLEDINMPENIKELLNKKQGLILIVGPTGCGKSTTLASMIKYINDNRKENIVTLEDPIEFMFNSNKSLISQRQLGEDMISFSSGLKHILRQDPNVIMIGEMRDLETIASAVTLAETGHLILGTLHTYSAAKTVDRIIDIFPPHQQSQIKSQLSTALEAVISQRLLPKKDEGRIAAREIMIKNSAISNLIRENKIAQIKSVIETGREQGMLTMENDLKDLYEKNLISSETYKQELNRL